MYHLYAGDGFVEDADGTNRVLHVTVHISDQLRTWDAGPGEPVNLKPGQHLRNGRYQFKLLDWRVVVQGIGTFFGQAGSLYLEFMDPGFADRQFIFDSDVNSRDYDWIGGITMEHPEDWIDPSAPDYGHLPRIVHCNGSDMGQIVFKIFPLPKFVLKRVHGHHFRHHKTAKIREMETE
jgi:hypothetical protein